MPTNEPRCENMPARLCALPQWVLWRGEKKTDTHGHETLNKIPYTVRYKKASSTDPATWTTFARACQALPLALDAWREELGDGYRGGGIGFVLTPPFVGIDLDHVRDPATEVLTPEALAILERFADTYAELSVSGTGVHILLEGTLPPGRRRKGHIEMYQEGRFFTMSGERLLAPDILPCQEALDAFYAETFPLPVAKRPRPAPLPTPLHSSEILHKARTAKNGGKFLALWQGDTSGYTSPSEADAALCSMLAFWTQDAQQIDDLFRSSGLMRDKWETARGHDATYGSQTIAHAIAHLGARYTPHADRHTPSLAAPPLARNGTTPHAPVGVEDDTATPEGQPIALRCDKEGKPYADAGNFRVIFRHYPPWKGAVWWDAFSQRLMHNEAPMTDADITHAAAWCGDALRMSVRAEEQLRKTLVAVAQESPRDPLLTYVGSLPPWDGIERCAHWAIDHCDVTDTAAHRWISHHLLVCLVARALQPGIQQRTIFVLHGPQNKGKSALLKCLGDPWYMDLSLSLESKEAHMAIQGKWLAELGELNAFTRTEMTRIKAFATMQVDEWRPLYAQGNVQSPRRTVFVGTTNEAMFLRDETGNTRFLTLAMGNDEFDLRTLRAQREQLYAEAKAFFLAHQEDWWRIPESIIADIHDLREATRIPTPYEEDLDEWLTTNGYEEITWPEVAKQYLHLEHSRWNDKGIQMVIGKTLRALGWRNTQLRYNGRNHKVWMKK